MQALMVDALGSAKGTRLLTRDVVGCGPRWVCGILERAGVGCRIQLCEDFLGSKAGDRTLDLLLVSAMTMDLPALRKIGRKARRIAPACLTVVGGPVCGSPRRVLAASGFDLAVSGEGEDALGSILAGKDRNQIPGLSYRQGDRVVVNPPAHRLDEERYNQFYPSTQRIIDYPTHFASRVYVEVVRGCSNFNRTRIRLADGRSCSECGEDCRRARCPQNIPPGCGFCSVPSTFGPPKSRRTDLVGKEVEELVRLGVRRIVLSAPDFLDYWRGRDLVDPGSPRPNYAKIGDLLSTCRAAADGRARISIENVKPSLFDDEAASIVARNLPSTEVHIGCETGDEPHSSALGRPSTPLDSFRAARIARKHGLRPHAYFIHGLPGQTLDSARKTSQLMHRMEPYVEKITVYRFKPLPGSAFEGERAGPPRWEDTASNLIAEAAREINLRKKDAYVGRTMEAIGAEPNMERMGEVFCFPVAGGPMVTVRGSRKLIGGRLNVRVTKALSERLLAGEVVGVIGK